MTLDDQEKIRRRLEMLEGSQDPAEQAHASTLATVLDIYAEYEELQAVLDDLETQNEKLIEALSERPGGEEMKQLYEKRVRAKARRIETLERRLGDYPTAEHGYLPSE